MRFPTLGLVAIAAIAAVAALGSPGAASAAGGAQPTRDHGHGVWFRRVCSDAANRSAGCGAQVVTNSAGTPLASGSPPAAALTPVQLHSAYALPTTAPSAQTIAIVDAFDDPSIASDLNTFDTTFGLPACTTANGCFTKVSQTGGTHYPASSSSWALEIALDVETAHAVCQNCNILLVEADSNSIPDLGTAENEAVALGATEISDSWVAPEYSTESADEASYFDHPGIPITVAAGDDGFGTGFPAASLDVVSVGGTTLSLNGDGSYGGETAWSGTGSGCSGYESKPAWQTDSGCTHRSLNDIAADADPNSGVAVYDSVRTQGQSGWFQVGGTSLASPLIASVYALAANPAATGDASLLYSRTAFLHDVTSDSDGSCSPSYLCTAGAGYDGPTGLGTPNGLGAFSASQPTTLTVSPGTASAGATVTVNWSGVSGQTGTDWVGLYQPGAPNASYLDWFYDSTCTKAAGPAAAAGTCSYTLPYTAGLYELRLFANDSFTRLATSSTVTVTAAASPSLGATPLSVTTGEQVTATWSDVASPSATDWIGVYPTGSPAGGYLGWVFDSSCLQAPGAAAAAGTCPIEMPLTPGTYELRLYANNGYTLLATSGQVTVTAGAAPTLGATPATIAPGGKVTFTWSSVAAPTSTDWIGVYATGADDASYLAWVYDATCTQSSGAAVAAGSCTLTMPTTPGTYELRLYAANELTRLATSGTVTVSAGP